MGLDGVAGWCAGVEYILGSESDYAGEG